MPTAIVSKKTLTEIRRIIDEHNGSITVGLSPARIQLCVKANGYDGVFSSRLIDANYPDYQAIFDLGFNQEAIVSTKDFLQSIDRISTILSKHPIMFLEAPMKKLTPAVALMNLLISILMQHICFSCCVKYVH
jgi:hypothetical protein